jgi:PAS domain S-box-containing protein
MEEVQKLRLALSETRARLNAALSNNASFFENAPFGCGILDSAGVILRGNQRLSSILGKDVEILKGLDFGTFVDPSDQKRWVSMLHQPDHSPGGCVITIVHSPPGRKTFLSVVELRAADRILDGDGNRYPRGSLLLSVRAASLLSDTEQAVIHAKQEWEQTFDAVHDPMALIDENHRIVRVNRALADRLGTDPKQCLGRNCYELIHGRKSAIEDCPHGLPLSTDESYVQMERYEPKLGGYFITTVTPFRRPGRKERWSVHVFHDISRRRKMEDALRISEGRFRAITENTADITALLRGGAFHYISPAAKNLLGVDPESLIGRRPEDIIHPEDWPAHEHFLQRVERAGGRTLLSSETRFRHQEGDWVSMEVKATHMPDTPGVEGIVVVYRDITDKKQMAFQLQQSLKLESIGRLAGGVAHEFNNVLGIVIGNAELAINDLPAGSTGRSFLQEILDAGLRARDVVRQLLMFSQRTPSGRKTLSLAPMVTETIRLMRASIPPHIKIKSKFPVPHEPISADPHQIRQMLIHLFANAFQAMETNRGSLDITIERVTLDEAAVSLRFPSLRPGKFVELTIKDSGHGIAPNMVEHIFDPYFSTRKAFKNSGMGLAMVQGIVKSHGGVITVDSQPDRGTSFRVYFPVAETPDRGASRPEKVEPRGKEHVVLVDDEAILLKTMGLMLERLGYAVESFSNPEEALKRFKESPESVDLLLTDMTMPEMDGLALTEAVLAIRPELPVIISSGYSERLTGEDLSIFKTVTTLSKPFDSSDLANALRKSLSGPESN